MERISFVIPCYGSSSTIEHVVNDIRSNMSKMQDLDFEIILVNDFSPDNVWQVITDLCEDPQIIGIQLAKNFGQASAVMAGFSNSSGDYIITLDDDGQSPVDAITAIIEKCKNDHFDVVYGVCKKAGFPLFRNIGSKINSLMAAAMFDRPKNHRIISLCILRKFVVSEMLHYHNPYTYLSGLVYRTTRNIGYLPVEHRKRETGRSGYTFKKLLAVWINGLTAFSIKPLHLATIFGFIASFLGIFFGSFTIINKILHPEIAAGWSSMISITLIMDGIILMVFGLIGEYIGRIYMSINNTPQYVIREIINQKEDQTDEP